MRTFGLALLTLVTSVIKSIAGGGVLACLWNWFILTASMFPNAPMLTISSAIGLMIVIDFFLCGMTMSVSIMSTHASNNDQPDVDVLLVKSLTLNGVMVAIIYPVTLFGGYLWHQFI